MKKLLSVLLIVMLVLSMCLAGCSNTSEEKTTEATTKAPSGETTTKAPSGETTTTAPATGDSQIILTYAENPASFDLHAYNTTILRTIQSAVREPLVREYKYEAVPSGAESWDISEDGLTWTFHLRKDLYWNDGVQVVAQHYVDSFERCINPNSFTPSGGAEAAMFKNGTEYYSGTLTDFSQVGYKAVDDFTLEMTLAYPNGTLLSAIRASFYLPIRIDKVQEWGDKFGSSPDYVMNCGPYVLDEWVHEQYITLKKNPDYWNAANIALDTVRFEIVASSETAALLFEEGEVDYVALSSTQILEYNTNEFFHQEVYDSCFGMFFRKTHEYFQNEDLVKAFGWIIDREGLCVSLYNGAYTPALTVFSPGTLDAWGMHYDHNPWVGAFELGPNEEKAQQYLQKGLSTLGITADMIDSKIMTGDGESTRLMAEYLQDTWNTAFGTNIGVDLYVSSTRWANERTGNYDIDFSGFTGDGTLGWSSWEYGGNYYKHTGFVEQPYFQTFQGLVDMWKAELDPEKQSRIAGIAEQMLLDHVVWTPIYNGSQLYLFRHDKFEGFSLDKAGMQLNYIFTKPIA